MPVFISMTSGTVNIVGSGSVSSDFFSSTSSVNFFRDWSAYSDCKIPSLALDSWLDTAIRLVVYLSIDCTGWLSYWNVSPVLSDMFCCSWALDTTCSIALISAGSVPNDRRTQSSRWNTSSYASSLCSAMLKYVCWSSVLKSNWCDWKYYGYYCACIWYKYYSPAISVYGALRSLVIMAWSAVVVSSMLLAAYSLSP